MTIDEFLRAVRAIQAMKPAYRLGHSGEDGYCDCIGLVIGALKRCGVSWTAATARGAIHGSNWAARYALTQPFPAGFERAEELAVGDLVFKYIAPGSSGYALPGRYRQGMSCDCGVYLDFMHVGVVESVAPLRIIHCASGGVKVDTRIGKWRAHGTLKVLSTEMAPAHQTVAHATLRRGSRGNEVTLLQELLNRRGAALEEDGVFGKLTEQAVRAFQRGAGLSADGVVGKMTWAALTEEAGA